MRFALFDGYPGSRSDDDPVFSLYLASERGDIAGMTNLILNKHADPNGHVEVIGDTPLHGAAKSGQNAAVDLLLRHGASVNSQDVHGSSPLDMALFFGHHDTAAKLSSNGGVSLHPLQAHRTGLSLI